jgi:hypothetical protein
MRKQHPTTPLSITRSPRFRCAANSRKAPCGWGGSAANCKPSRWHQDGKAGRGHPRREGMARTPRRKGRHLHMPAGRSFQQRHTNKDASTKFPSTLSRPCNWFPKAGVCKACPVCACAQNRGHIKGGLEACTKRCLPQQTRVMGRGHRMINDTLWGGLRHRARLEHGGLQSCAISEPSRKPCWHRKCDVSRSNEHEQTY